MDGYVTMQGNLTADPRQRVTASGQVVTSFRIASTPRRKDPATGEWVDGRPNFIDVSCWRALAGNVHASLRKGDGVVVYGRLVFREYDDKDGVHRREHEIDAVAVGPDLNKSAADPRRVPRQDRAAQPAGAPGAAPAGSAAVTPPGDAVAEPAAA